MDLRLMLVALFACFGLGAWADEVTWKASEQGYSNGQEVPSIALDDNVSVALAKGSNSNAPKYYNTGTALRAYGGNTLTFSGGTITAIQLTFSNGEGTNEITADPGTYANGSWTGSASEVVLTIGGSTGHRRIATITVTYTPLAAAVEKPVITPASGSYFGPQQVAITAEQGCDIFYTVNGGDEQKYSAPFTVSETSTIVAYAKDAAGASSNKTTTTLTIGASYTSLAEAIKAIPQAVAQVTTTQDKPWTVTKAEGRYNYLTDGTDHLLVFGPNEGIGIATGDQVYGSIAGQLTVYNGSNELVVASASDCNLTQIAEDVTVKPEEVTAADLIANLQALDGHYVQLSGFTVDEAVTHNSKTTAGQAIVENISVKVGDETIVLRTQFLMDFTLEAETQYDVIGIAVNYVRNGEVTPEIYPVIIKPHLAESKEFVLEFKSVTGRWYEGFTANAPIAEILEVLGAESIDEVTISAMQGDGTLDPNYKLGTTDGWRKADGTWQGWGTDARICVKADFSTESNQIYYVGGMENQTAEEATYTATYVFQYNDNVAKLIVKLIYEAPVAVDITFADLTQKDEMSVDFTSTVGQGFEGMSDNVDIAAILTKLGVESLDEVSIYAVQSDGTLDDNYSRGTTDGWRDANGDWLGFGNASFYVKANFTLAENQLYEVGGMASVVTEPATFTATYAFVKKGTKDAVVLKVNLTYEAGQAKLVEDYTCKGTVDVTITGVADEAFEAVESDTYEEAAISALIGEAWGAEYGIGPKTDDGKATFTDAYSCDPHPGFWCLADGTADNWSNGSFGVSVVWAEDYSTLNFRAWTKEAVTEPLTTTFFFVNEETKEYVAYNVTLQSEELPTVAANELDFEGTSAIEGGICTYAKDMATNNVSYYGLQAVEGWDIAMNPSDNEAHTADAPTDQKAGGVFAYGSGVWLGGNAFAAPAEGPEGTNGKAIGLISVWGGDNAIAQYTQDVTLPAGNYVITVPVMNTAGTNALTQNLIGFIAEDGTTHLATTKQYPVGQWYNETISFTLAEETKGKLSIGIQNASGSGAAPHLFIDRMDISVVTAADIARAELEAALTPAEAVVEAKANVGDALFQKPEAAYNEYADKVAALRNVAATSKDAEALKAAVAALAEATAAYNAAVNAPEADAVYSIQLKEGGMFMTLNEGTKLGEEAVGLSFVPVEGGYAITNGTEYAAMTGTGNNTWTMGAATEPYAWVVTAMPNGYYTIAKASNTAQLIGADNAAAGSSCYADKTIAKVGDRAYWSIKKLEPIFTYNVNSNEGRLVRIINGQIQETGGWSCQWISNDDVVTYDVYRNTNNMVFTETGVDMRTGQVQTAYYEVKCAEGYEIVNYTVKGIPASQRDIATADGVTYTFAGGEEMAFDVPVSGNYHWFQISGANDLLDAQVTINIRKLSTKDELKDAIAKAEAEKKETPVGGLFQKSQAAADAYAEAIAAANAALADAAGTDATRQAAIEALATATATFEAAAVIKPAANDKYTIQNRANNLYLSFDPEGEKTQVIVSEQPVEFSWVENENGTWYLTDGENYVSKKEGSGWDMAPTAEPNLGFTPAAIQLEDGTFYSLATGASTVMGIDLETNGAFYDKTSAATGNGYWIITKVENGPATTDFVLNVDRYVGMGYGVTVAEADLAAAAEFLGVEAVTTDMLRIVNPDGSMISDYAPFDGWFNAEGAAETWSSLNQEGNVRPGICVKFFQALNAGTYEICDMNGADEVGKTYSVKWALEANGKTAFYTVNVNFVEAPLYKPEIVKSILVLHKELAETPYSDAEPAPTFDVAEVCQALGIADISEAKPYIVNVTNGAFVENTTDGWRDANGDAAQWADASNGFCVKLNNPASGEFDYTGAHDANFKAGQTYIAQWGLVAGEKAVLLKVYVMFVNDLNEMPTEPESPYGFWGADVAATDVNGGDYYLYNIGTKQFLTGSNSWGTQASRNDVGTRFTVAELEDGTFTLDSHISNGGNSHFLGNGGYVDAAAFGFTLTKVEDETEGVSIYTIGDGTNLYVANAENTIVEFKAADATDPMAQWMLVNKSERLKLLAKATPENPVDATFMILCSDFGRNDQYIGEWNGAPVRGGNNDNQCAEKFNTNFDIYQVVKWIPAGQYEVSVQGFYRAGGFAENTDAQNAFLYANGVETPLIAVATEGADAAGNGYSSQSSNGKFIPNSMNEASTVFTAGAYTNNKLVTTVYDLTMTLGVKKDVTIANDWTIFDSFRIKYLGYDEPTTLAAAKKAYDAKVAEAKEIEATLSSDGIAIIDEALEANNDAAYTTSWEYAIAVNNIQDAITKATAADKEDLPVATSIDGIMAGADNQSIYDLSGRKVAKVQKGIYIVNGKKVAVK